MDYYIETEFIQCTLLIVVIGSFLCCLIFFFFEFNIIFKLIYMYALYDRVKFTLQKFQITKHLILYTIIVPR